jgi:hypothetical protein
MNHRRPNLLAQVGQQLAADRIASRPATLADDPLGELAGALNHILARPAVTRLGPAGFGVTS